MKIQASMNTGPGDPATVYSLWKDQRLVVSKVVRYRKDRFSNSVIIADDALPERESFFEPAHLVDAIECYMHMKNAGELVILDAAVQANPEHAVQVAENTSVTTRYQLTHNVTNAVMAVLATCWHVKRTKSIDSNLDMMDALSQITAGNGVTI